MRDIGQLNFSVPWFLHVWNGSNKIPLIMRLLWGSNGIICVKLLIKYLVQSNCLIIFVVVKRRGRRRSRRRRRRRPRGDTVNIYWINTSLDCLSACIPQICSSVILTLSPEPPELVLSWFVTWSGKCPSLSLLFPLIFIYISFFKKNQNYTCMLFKEEKVLDFFLMKITIPSTLLASPILQRRPISTLSAGSFDIYL